MTESDKLNIRSGDTGTFYMPSLTEFPSEILNAPFPESVVEEKEIQGNVLDFVPWHIYAAYLNWKLPGRWEKEITAVKEAGGQLIVCVRVIVDGVIRDALGTADAEKQSWGGAMAEAESQAFRRACAAHGLGLYMYRDGEHAPADAWSEGPSTPGPSEGGDEPQNASEEPDEDEPTEKQLLRLRQYGKSGYLPEKFVSEQREILSDNFTKKTAGAIIRRMADMLEKLGYDPEAVKSENPTPSG